jgi:uncharacterized protein YecT (DUF1311 family)
MRSYEFHEMRREGYEPWSDLTYNGFAGGAAPQVRLRAEPAAHRRLSPRAALMGGVAAALAAGLAVGLWARPDVDRRSVAERDPVPAAASTAPTAPPPASAVVPVEVVPVKPAPVPASTGRMEVLPPDMTASARTPPSQAWRRMLAPLISPAPPPAPRVVNTPAPVSAPPTVNPPPAVVAEEPSVSPSFNCRRARTAAEQMVCGDDRLARLDQRLDQAFRQAVASGTPYRELRDEQDDWLQIREDAARRSPEAVASVYRQRIAELRDMSGEPD